MCYYKKVKPGGLTCRNLPETMGEIMNEKTKISNKWRFLIVFVSIVGLFLLVFMVAVLSFQDGDSSSSETLSIAVRLADQIYEKPTRTEIEAVGLMLRFCAHLGLFFIVGMMTTFVSMVIFKRYYRILGVAVSAMICYMLAYYTEYYKQYIAGRHFQETDVVLNRYGSAAGIVCMIVFYFLNRLLVKLSS